MKAYPKYKDAGVPWLKHVPEHWEIKRSKSVFRTLDIRSAEGKEELLSVSEKNGVALRKNTSVTMFQAASYTGYKLCWPNDLVINSLWAWMTGLGFSKYHGIISTAYSVFRIWNQGKFHSDYGNYLLRSKTYNWEFRVRSKGIWRSRYQLADDSFLAMPLLIPPLDEQQQISRYLDWQTSKINKFIKAKKRLITLLRTQTEILSFGKQDNSQIPIYEEWKNLFPKHWRFEKAKRVFCEINIKNNENKELLAVTQDRGVLLKRMCSQNYVSPAGSVSGLKLVRTNDFVISLRSFQGGIEFSEYEGIVSPAYTVMSLDNDFNSKKLRVFYRVLFKSKNFIRLLNTVISGIRDGKNISFTDFSKLEIPIPPEDELNELLESFDRYKRFEMISNREVELIQEYRTRLVSDVVTGKVDIRSVEIPDFEPVEAELEAQDDEESEDELITEGIEE